MVMGPSTPRHNQKQHGPESSDQRQVDAYSAVVELIAKKGAKIRYTTIQNWSRDVYNLVSKRAYA